MIVDPIQLLIKTTANYVAFKTVKTSIDYVWNRNESVDQYTKSVECMLCMNVWTNDPIECPHCSCQMFKRLYREYNKQDEDDLEFAVDSNLTMRGKNDPRR